MDRSYVEENASSLTRLKQLVARLDDAQLRMEMADGWTVAAYLAHLAFWDRRASILLTRFASEPVAPSPYDPHLINDALLPQWRLIPPRQAAEDALVAAEEADQLAASVADDLLSHLASVPVGARRATHRTLHLDEIEPLFA